MSGRESLAIRCHEDVDLFREAVNFTAAETAFSGRGLAHALQRTRIRLSPAHRGRHREPEGELGDKANLREALRTTITRIRPPRGPVQFDAYQQVITTVYVMKVERRGDRLVNAIVDQIPNVSQEATWKWWQR